MFLTIITINRNNAEGLVKTMQSVLSQTRSDYEYVVVDGASTDDSVAVIERLAPAFGDRLKWISEPDKGIYNAMNKGLGMVEGKYVLFLNSGDCFASPNVVDNVFQALEAEEYPPILYGNRIEVYPDGHTRQIRPIPSGDFTFFYFYLRSLPHQTAFIQRVLFDKYGLYDESLKIVSDWKWFMQVIALGGERTAFADIDIVFYDMTGISNTNKSLHLQERRQVLSALIPASILADYEARVFEIRRTERLKRHPWAYKLVCFLERCLIKWEKWTKARKKK